MNELSLLLDEMVKTTEKLFRITEELKECLSSTIAVCKPQLTKEDIRSLLIEKLNSNGGKNKVLVKALVGKYSESGSLNGVKQEDYAALSSELEVL